MFIDRHGDIRHGDMMDSGGDKKLDNFPHY